jgi:hypothetical protein
MYVGNSNEYLKCLLNIYRTAENHRRYGVLIHDSYPDVRLFHSQSCGDFPSWCLQLLQWLWCHYSVAWPGRGQSVTELMPFMNFSVHPYTCCSDKHASPYWTFIRRWISMGFTPSLPCSSFVHVASKVVIFTLLLRCCVEFLHCTATCWQLFKPWVTLLPT